MSRYEVGQIMPRRTAVQVMLAWFGPAPAGSASPQKLARHLVAQNIVAVAVTIPSTMALATKFLICLAFFFGGVYCHGIRQSYGSGTARQTCPDGYYCPSDRQCKSPRSSRCTSSQNCTGLDDCNESDECYLIRIGRSPLTSSGSSSKFTLPEFNHQFVVYRGFAYEFGNDYLQVLDIADPKYRYAGDKDVTGYTTDGTSCCTYDDAAMFVNCWNRQYSLAKNNCQHFAKAFSNFLQTASCNQQGGDKGMLMEDIDEILSNCTTMCCNCGISSGGSALITSVPIMAFAFIYTFFAVFI